MGKELLERNAQSIELFHEADDLLSYPLSKIMFEGSAEELKQTKVTQPAIFLHSIFTFKTAETLPSFGAVAGHSLGEFSALVANGCLDWREALKLVQLRALAMQSACEATEGTMAAVIGLDDDVVDRICNEINETVVAANFNCPGQIVISGSIKGIELASEALQNAGARRVLPLAVGGAFHSSLMSPAQEELKEAINQCNFKSPNCPVYQNVNGQNEIKPEAIKKNLIDQLDSPVQWTRSMKNMMDDGFERIVEVGGKGKVLSGMFKRLNRNIVTESLDKLT